MSTASSPDGASRITWRSNCPVSCALDVLGDRWSLLIIRDLLLHGSRTYTQLREADEGISTNILADRLQLLAGLDLIERTDPDRPARDNPWVLTEHGAGLRQVVVDIATWSSTAFAAHNPDIVRLPAR